MGKLQCDFRVVGAVQTNCYFLGDNETGKCILVDPGDGAGEIRRYLEKKGWEPEAILLTHGHFDHILAVSELKGRYKIPVYAAEAEREAVLSDRFAQDFALAAKSVRKRRFSQEGRQSGMGGFRNREDGG